MPILRRSGTTAMSAGAKSAAGPSTKPHATGSLPSLATMKVSPSVDDSRAWRKFATFGRARGVTIFRTAIMASRSASVSADAITSSDNSGRSTWRRPTSSPSLSSVPYRPSRLSVSPPSAASPASLASPAWVASPASVSSPSSRPSPRPGPVSTLAGGGGVGSGALTGGGGTVGSRRLRRRLCTRHARTMLRSPGTGRTWLWCLDGGDGLGGAGAVGRAAPRRRRASDDSPLARPDARLAARAPANGQVS